MPVTRCFGNSIYKFSVPSLYICCSLHFCQLVQLFYPLPCDTFRHLGLHFPCICSRASRKWKSVYSGKVKLAAHSVRFLKIFFRFTGKTGDDIHTDKRIVFYTTEFGYCPIHSCSFIAAVHRFKYGVAA